MGRLRIAAAAIVGLAGLALAAGGAGPLGWLLVIVGWLATLGWLATARRSSKRVREAERYRLELGEEALTLALGGEPLRIPWSDVREVTADEDTLTVRIERAGGDPVAIPLLWRDAGLHDLAEAIEQTRAACSPRPAT